MHVLDREDRLTMDRNIILPLDRLVYFLENTFDCKRCPNRLTRCDKERSEPPLGLEVFGLACGLNFNCWPKVVPESLHKIGPVADKKNNRHNRLNSGDFEINEPLHLGLQLSGNGRHDGAILTGMLKLNVNPMPPRWTEVQESLAKAIILIGGEVLDENLHLECMHSPIGKVGPYTLVVTSDTRWDKQGTNLDYNPICRSELNQCRKFALNVRRAYSTMKTFAQKTMPDLLKEWRQQGRQKLLVDCLQTLKTSVMLRTS
jgi:hypothetical protein